MRPLQTTGLFARAWTLYHKFCAGYCNHLRPELKFIYGVKYSK